MIYLKRFLEFRRLVEEAEIEDEPVAEEPADEGGLEDEFGGVEDEGGFEDVDIGDDPDANPDTNVEEEEESDEGRFDREEDTGYLAELTFMEIEKKIKLFFSNGKFSHQAISTPIIETKIWGDTSKPQVTVLFNIREKLQFKWTIVASLEDLAIDQKFDFFGIEMSCYDYEGKKLAVYRDELEVNKFKEKFFIDGMDKLKKQINALANANQKGLDLLDQVF